jgi:AraC-like DNA-binding protein
MPSGYFTTIVRGHASTPRDEAALLEGTGVAATALGARTEITLGQQLRQIRNATQHLDPGWSLETGTRLGAIAHGPLSFATVCAPSIGQGLRALVQFGYLRAPHMQLLVRPSGNEVRLVMEDRVALTAQESRALLDIVMLSNQALIESQLGRPMYEGRFEFPYPAPEYARRYAELFHCPVRFGCPEAAVVVPAGWLSVESPFVDPTAYHDALERLCLSARRFEGDRRLVARVEQILAQRGARLGLRRAAHLLGVSDRTLTRRLGGQGTSFQTLADESRKTRAVALLQDPTLTVAEIAYALDYEDAANFGRAFRRWFGISPGKYRRTFETDGSPALDEL